MQSFYTWIAFEKLRQLKCKEMQISFRKFEFLSMIILLDTMLRLNAGISV